MIGYIQGTFRDGSGHVVGGGSVTVYLAGTTNLATIYSDSACTIIITSATSATDGSFKFYVNDTGLIEYDVVLSAPGYVSKTYLAQYPSFLTPVMSEFFVEHNTNGTHKYEYVYNVKAYGAKGDGTTDDTTAIQAAITAVGSSGGIIQFPTGNYAIYSTLNIPASYAGLTLKGTGNGTVYITYIPATGNGITFLGEADQFTMENITVYSSNSSTGWAIYSNQGSAAPFRYPHFKNVSYAGFLKGLHIGGGINVWIEGGNQTGQGKSTAGGIGIQIGEDVNHSCNAAVIDMVYPATYYTGIYNKYCNPLRINGSVIANVTIALRFDIGVNELHSVYFDLADTAIDQGGSGAYIFNYLPDYASNGTNTITLINQRYREVSPSMWAVRASSSSPLSVAQNTPTIIPMGVTAGTYDDSGQWGSNVYTAKIPGLYKVKGQCTWDTRGVGTYKLHIYHNASAVATNARRMVGTDTSIFKLSLPISDTVWLSTGDTVSLYGEHDSATTPETIESGATETFIVVEGI
jgi:hypothetical protein